MLRLTELLAVLRFERFLQAPLPPVRHDEPSVDMSYERYEDPVTGEYLYRPHPSVPNMQGG